MTSKYYAGTATKEDGLIRVYVLTKERKLGMEDKTLICVDCGNQFIWMVRDQEFFASKGFASPKRCKPCRDVKKQSKQRQDQQRG